MRLLFKIFQYTVCCKNVIATLESLVSEYGHVEEIISGDGKQNLKNSHQTVTRAQYNSGAVFPRGKNMLVLMPLPRIYHSHNSSQYGYRKASNVSLCQPARVIPTPGESVVSTQMVPNTGETVWCHKEESYWMKGCQCHQRQHVWI